MPLVNSTLSRRLVNAPFGVGIDGNPVSLDTSSTNAPLILSAFGFTLLFFIYIYFYISPILRDPNCVAPRSKQPYITDIHGQQSRGISEAENADGNISTSSKDREPNPVRSRPPKKRTSRTNPLHPESSQAEKKKLRELIKRISLGRFFNPTPKAPKTLTISAPFPLASPVQPFAVPPSPVTPPPRIYVPPTDALPQTPKRRTRPLPTTPSFHSTITKSSLDSEGSGGCEIIKEKYRHHGDDRHPRVPVAAARRPQGPRMLSRVGIFGARPSPGRYPIFHAGDTTVPNRRSLSEPNIGIRRPPEAMTSEDRTAKLGSNGSTAFGSSGRIRRIAPRMF